MPLKSLRMSPYDLEYRPRVVDAELQTLLSAGGAVLIEGPRACGKTETARQVAASEVSLETDAFALAASKLDPSILLDGPTPRLIDEWQLVPAISVAYPPGRRCARRRAGSLRPHRIGRSGGRLHPTQRGGPDPALADAPDVALRGRTEHGGGGSPGAVQRVASPGLRIPIADPRDRHPHLHRRMARPTGSSLCVCSPRGAGIPERGCARRRAAGGWRPSRSNEGP